VLSDATEDDIKACIVVRDGAAVAPRELFEFFTANLPYFAIPRYVEVVDTLPTNAAGRVMKHQLVGRASAGDVWDLDALGLTVARSRRR